MGKKQNFIRRFDNHSDYETFTGSTDFIRPNVSACVSEKEIHYNPVEIPVDSVSLSETSITINQGETYELVATVLPINASDKGVTWGTDNADVATVNSNGIVTAIGSGNCIITVTTNNGREATCEVLVN